MGLWQSLARPILFHADPERVHHLAMSALHRSLSLDSVRARVHRSLCVDDPRLASTLFGVHFPRPVGLAAGFDKEGLWINALGALGFGAVEIGTLTGRPQPGNPKPRLFRLPQDQALLNRMGFNNRGSAWAAEALARLEPEPVVGINIGKSKVVPNHEAIDDYLVSLRHLHAFADYLVINVSSPNTVGLRDLQEKEPLLALLTALQAEKRRLDVDLPILLKIAPDLSDSQLDDIASIALSTGIAGLIATNTTITRHLKTPTAVVTALGDGGVSGGPLTLSSRAVVAKLYRRVGGQLPIIGVGGIMTGEDAWEMIRAGASLLQVYTGFIYGGPTFIHDLHRDLLRRLDACGADHISQIVGETHG